jgi:hypothetical protein
MMFALVSGTFRTKDVSVSRNVTQTGFRESVDS